jgi:Spy/CpxP family protein refolding chaperone
MVSKSRVTAVGLLVAVAVAGFAAGFATSSWAGGKRNGRERQGWSSHLTRELGLTPQQSDSVKAILRRRRPEMRAVFETVRPRMDSVRQHINAEIRAVLTPEQRGAFEAMLERERARVERWRADSAGREGARRGQ